MNKNAVRVAEYLFALPLINIHFAHVIPGLSNHFSILDTIANTQRVSSRTARTMEPHFCPRMMARFALVFKDMVRSRIKSYNYSSNLLPAGQYLTPEFTHLTGYYTLLPEYQDAATNAATHVKLMCLDQLIHLGILFFGLPYAEIVPVLKKYYFKGPIPLPTKEGERVECLEACSSAYWGILAEFNFRREIFIYRSDLPADNYKHHSGKIRGEPVGRICGCEICVNKSLDARKMAYAGVPGTTMNWIQLWREEMKMGGRRRRYRDQVMKEVVKEMTPARRDSITAHYKDSGLARDEEVSDTSVELTEKRMQLQMQWWLLKEARRIVVEREEEVYREWTFLMRMVRGEIDENDPPDYYEWFSPKAILSYNILWFGEDEAQNGGPSRQSLGTWLRSLVKR
jgi:hypothetical protein